VCALSVHCWVWGELGGRTVHLLSSLLCVHVCCDAVAWERAVCSATPLHCCAGGLCSGCALCRPVFLYVYVQCNPTALYLAGGVV
jgi:hypothetical protein